MRYALPTPDCVLVSTARPSGGRRSLCDAWLRLHALLLLGYALGGKSFAYLGVLPIYIGELVLLCGLLALLATGAALRIPRSPTLYALGALFAWCGWLTLRGLPAYGMDALRDSVIWSYALFAVIVACALVSRPERLRRLVERYARFGRIFVLLVPGIWTFSALYGDRLPRLPGTEISLLQIKATDTLLHLFGVAGFQFLGLGPASASTAVAFGLGFIVLSTRSRGVMLGVMLGLLVLAATRPLRRRLWIAGAVLLGLLPLLLTVDFGVSIRHRELSTRQVVANVTSIFRGDVSRQLEGTKQWRLEWWSKIVGYTVYGRHFWTGKGFGKNLAHDDGFDLKLEIPLRSPHNAHLDMLGRAGVPGLALWILVQVAWLLEMLRRYRVARRAGHGRWERLFVLLIAYWLAMLVNASFDVALEGPMSGIWFWSLFGVGIGAARIHARRPGVLELVRPVRAPARPWTARPPGERPSSGPGDRR